MKCFKSLFIAAAFVVAASSAQATVLDFASDAQGNEQGYSTLSYSSWFNVDIKGHSVAGDAYAYMDSGYGGLGVCKNLNSADQCNPGNDDNTTVGEWLTFVFDTDVFIKNLWVNNYHDDDKSLTGDSITITNGGPSFNVAGKNSEKPAGSYTSASSIGSYYVSAGTAFTMAYFDEEFYVTAMEVVGVPETGSLVLFMLGLVGLGAARRRSQS